MHQDERAPIIRKESWNDYHLLAVESSPVAHSAQPGQFLMVRASSHPYPLLRRPFSIHSRNGRVIEIFFLKSGLGTSLLAQKKEGETLDLLGPLGIGFRLGRPAEGKSFFLVGGGRGIAPLYFLAQELEKMKADLKIFYGGKTEADLPLLSKFETTGFKVLSSTENGSFGFKGLVSELFEEELARSRPEAIYACGPEAMMKKIASLAAEKSVSAQFSLESVMGCGFGACWGCVKRIRREGKEEWLKICEEGPVFAGADVIWPEEFE